MSLVPSVVLTGHTSDVNCVDLSHSGLLVSCSNDKTLRIWKSSSSSASNDDADANGDDSVCLNFRENTTRQPVSPFIGHKYGVNCVKFSPFDTIIASGSTDGSIILWNAQVRFFLLILFFISHEFYRLKCVNVINLLLLFFFFFFLNFFFMTYPKSIRPVNKWSSYLTLQVVQFVSAVSVLHVLS